MTARPWTVHRPGPLTKIEEGLWTVDDEVPGLPGATRKMTVVKRLDGSLLFYNAIPVSDATVEQLRALGAPKQLIVPNQFHALDVAAFSQRLGLTAYCPAIAVEKLASRLACRPIEELPVDAALKVFKVEGFSTHEAVVVTGKTLIVADLVTNAPHVNSVMGWLMRLVGFTGPALKLPRPVRKRVGRDLEAVRRLLLELAELDVARIIPSHGVIVEREAAAALRAVAAAIPSSTG